MIVDFQHHFTPRELIKQDPGDRLIVHFDENGAPSYTIHSLLYDLDEHVRMMDTAGIGAAFLTSAAGMCASLEVSKLCNDKAKAAERDYPGRFIGAAHAHPLGGGDAMRELNRCAQELGFPGVVITSEMDGKFLDAPELEPFWAEAEKLGLFVFVHPALKLNYSQQFDGYDTARSVGREFSLVMATIRLINSGVFDRHPRLTVHMAHLGGGLAGVIARVRGYQDKDFWGVKGHPKHGRKAEKEFDHYIRQQHVFRHRRLLLRHRRGQRGAHRNSGRAHRVRHRLSAGSARARAGTRFRARSARARQAGRTNPVGQCGEADQEDMTPSFRPSRDPSRPWPTWTRSNPISGILEIGGESRNP